MKVQRRTLIALGVIAAAIGIGAGVRHCLQSMARSGDPDGAIDLHQRRSGHCCGPADRGRHEGNDQSEGTGRLAA